MMGNNCKPFKKVVCFVSFSLFCIVTFSFLRILSYYLRSLHLTYIKNIFLLNRQRIKFCSHLLFFHSRFLLIHRLLSSGPTGFPGRREESCFQSYCPEIQQEELLSVWYRGTSAGQPEDGHLLSMLSVKIISLLSLPLNDD